MFRWSKALALFLLGWSVPATATNLTFEFKQGAKKLKVERYALQGTMLRMDKGPKSTAPYFLFDGSGMELTLVSPRAKTFLILREQSVMAMKENALMMGRADKERLRSLPAGQRAVFLKGLQGKMRVSPQLKGFEAKVLPRIQKTKKMRKVAGYMCQVVELFRGKLVEQRLCVTSASKLGLSPQEAELLISFFETMQKLMQKFKSQPAGKESPLRWIKSAGGIPLQRVPVAKTGTRIELVGLEKKKLPPHAFSVPKTFKPQEIPAP